MLDERYFYFIKLKDREVSYYDKECDEGCDYFISHEHSNEITKTRHFESHTQFLAFLGNISIKNHNLTKEEYKQIEEFVCQKV